MQVNVVIDLTMPTAKFHSYLFSSFPHALLCERKIDIVRLEVLTESLTDTHMCNIE